jgi:hypothetical protein
MGSLIERYGGVYIRGRMGRCGCVHIVNPRESCEGVCKANPIEVIEASI